MIVIPVYSEQDLTPRAMEVIRAIVDAGYPDEVIKFREFNYRTDKRVLIFGSAPEKATGLELIYTYSIAQIMSKANAASVLIAGIRNFITEPKMPNFRPLGTISIGDAMASLDFDRPTAIDIETDGLLGKEQTPEEVQIISVALYQEGCPPIVIHSGTRWLDEKGRDGQDPLSLSQLTTLADMLPRFTKGIYHNGKFDTRVLNRVLGVKLCVWFDTMLAHHVLNHAAGDHKLKTLARRYLGAPEWEGDLSKWTVGGGHYELIPTDKLVEYNGWDVYWTFELYKFFEPQIMADDNNITAYTLEMSAAEFLLEVEQNGIPVDGDYALAYASDLESEQIGLLSKLERLIGKPLNPNSPKQVKEYMSDSGIPVTSTDEQHLTEALDEVGELSTLGQGIKLILAYRKAGKIRGTYAEGWLNKSRNGRVHPTFLVHGTSTGRLSSTSPNSQNVPRDKDIRKLVRVHG